MTRFASRAQLFERSVELERLDTPRTPVPCPTV